MAKPASVRSPSATYRGFEANLSNNLGLSHFLARWYPAINKAPGTGLTLTGAPAALAHPLAQPEVHMCMLLACL